MLDINFIRENPDKVKKGVVAKQMDPKIVDEVLRLDKKWRDVLKANEELRRKRNVIAEERTPEAITRGQEIKRELKKLQEDLLRITDEYETALKEVPNLIAEDVPFGKDESGNKPVRKWGKPLKFNFKPKDHVELGEVLDIIDIETASKVTGARFNYLKGDAALLQFALIQHTFAILADQKILKKIAEKIEKGYSAKPFVPVIPPVMIKSDVFDKMARLKPEEERYHIATDDLYLIGSAEHTLGPLHMDENIREEELPLRYVGYSTAFRREAGSYGKDTRGILRVHQFDKIEMESFTVPEDSIKEQDFIVGVQEYLTQTLEIPYQVVAICTGDMGKIDYRQIDIEMWMPGQNKYRETHTSDLMTDYQARRLGTKVMGKNGETEFVHMNDATAFAIGRTIIAILENYQQKDGSVDIPKVLQKYTGRDKITSLK